MKKGIIIFGLFLAVFIFYGCGNFKTRVETDIYTIVERDTTIRTEVKNDPGNRDNGIIYPSSRAVTAERQIIRRDSVVEREYPDFIRLGAFESVGLLFGGNKDYAAGTGLFGTYPDLGKFDTKYRGDKDNLFSGSLWRIGIGEWRLRWFRDAKDWTIGTSLCEVIAPDARIERMLISVLPIYIRKRYFLSEDIPYLSFTVAFGIGYFPSQYINVSGSLDLGSIGGMNLRAYLGLAAGANSSSSMQVKSSPYTADAQTVVVPYGGLGVSVLDFFNRVPETKKEWKDHEHSSWNIGLLQIDAISTGADKSIFDSDSTKDPTKFLSGIYARVAPVAVALPIASLDNKLYVGTSLISLMALGKSEWGLGILPIRVGYWQTVLSDELTTEPFIEFNYYPSSFVNIGNRLNLRLGAGVNLSFVLGFASGSGTKNPFGKEFVDQFGIQKDFSRVYVGLGIGLGDQIFYPEELRYNKKQ